MPRKSSPDVTKSWTRVIADWQRGGQSVAAFCRERKLSQPSFFFWRRRLSAAQPDTGRRPVFVPVDVLPSPVMLELVLTSGNRLRLPGDVNAVRLAEIVKALESAAC